MKRKGIIITFIAAISVTMAGCGGMASAPQSEGEASAGQAVETAATIVTEQNVPDANEGSLSQSGSQTQQTTAAQTQPVQSGAYDSLRSRLAQSSYGTLTFVSSDVSDYPTVRLYYSYTDNSGTPITLTAPMAGIKETLSGGGQIERTVKSIQRLDGNQGLSIDIVADKSDSMYADLYTMQTIMSEFVRNMDFNAGDQAEIIAFDSFIMYMCTYTKDTNLLTNGISNMTAYGMTRLYDALIEGINNAANQPGARCVIGFTDGIDNESSYTYSDVIRIANQKEVPVYIIGTSQADSYVLRDICSQTSGYYWDINSIYDMSGIMSQIYSNNKAMYCVEYESDVSFDAYLQRSVSCVVADNTYSCESANVTFTPVKAIEKTKHSQRYEVIKDDVTWTEANEKCIAKGGHLATITSQAEMDQLSKMAEDAGLKYAWMGGYTSVRNGSAFGHWVTGEPFDYTAWYQGEPSRNDKDGTPEFYLVLWNVKGKWSWNDERNDLTEMSYAKDKIGYICEYEY